MSTVPDLPEDVDGVISNQPMLGQREHFIPIRKPELLQLIIDSGCLSDEEHLPFRRFCRLLEATFHHEFHVCLETLKDNYSPFNPDRDTVNLREYPTSQRTELVESFFERVERLLSQANYRLLDRAALESAMAGATEWGLQLSVKWDAFQQLRVFARGEIMGFKTRKNWRTMYKEQVVEVPLFQKLVVIFQVRPNHRVGKHVDPDIVYLKMFKNIPQQDVDMLLPGSSVKMTWFDRIRIAIPTISGLGISVWKLASAGVAVAFAKFYSVLALLGIVGGTVGYGVKSFFGYLRTKDKYQLNLTRSLYFQNLDNNAGVLFRLLDEAEEQEFREAILGYVMLWKQFGDEGASVEQLDQSVEAFLMKHAELDTDFEIEDTMPKLERLGIAELAAPGQWRAIPLKAAFQRLDQAWDSVFQDDEVTAEKCPRVDF